MSIDRHSAEWYAALDAHVRARGERPFAWGSNDCCTFAADWVQTVRGNDPMQGLRGLNTALNALRTINALGGLQNAVTDRMGACIAGPLAQVGDVALVRHGAGRLSMGLCLGAHIAAPGLAGLLLLPIDQAEAAWRV